MKIMREQKKSLIFRIPIFFLCILIVLLTGCRLFSPSGTGGNPMVTIVSPVNGDTIRESNYIIKAEVASSEKILKIRFFDNNLFLGEVQEEPFEHLWEIAFVSNGEHTLKAEAVDHSGNIGNSPNVSVIVSKTIYDWNRVPSPTDQNLNSLFAFNRTSIWACGDNGTILHYDGSEWAVSTITPQITEDLFDLFFVSPDKGWCVGENILLKFESGVWNQLQTFTKEEFLSILVFYSPERGWVGNSEGEIFVFSYDSLSVFGILDSMEISDICGISQDDVWACCGNSFYHFNGAGWSRDTLFTGESIFTLSSPNNTTVWGGGTNLYYYNGFFWESGNLPVQGGILSAIYFIDSVNGIACGRNGATGFIISYDGDEWWEETVQITDKELQGICIFSNGEGWAVGYDGTILCRTGN